MWYEYVLYKENVSVYGAKLLLGPTRKPSLRKYTFWTNSIHLADPSFFLRGLFNFDPHSERIKPKQYVVLTHWEFLLTRCFTSIIVPPILSTLTDTLPVMLHKKKR